MSVFCEPISVYIQWKFEEGDKMCPLGNLLFLKFPRERLPAKGGSQLVEDWGWSGFKSWTHHLALIFEKLLSLWELSFPPLDTWGKP